MDKVAWVVREEGKMGRGEPQAVEALRWKRTALGGIQTDTRRSLRKHAWVLQG